MEKTIWLTFIAASIGFEALTHPAAPVGLLVNGASNPQALDRNAVRFTWRSEEAARGQMQTAYQIVVSSSAEPFATEKVDYWDSGKVDSEKSASVEYAGKELPAATRRERISDQDAPPITTSFDRADRVLVETRPTFFLGFGG